MGNLYTEDPHNKKNLIFFIPNLFDHWNYFFCVKVLIKVILWDIVWEIQTLLVSGSCSQMLSLSDWFPDMPCGVREHIFPERSAPLWLCSLALSPDYCLLILQLPLVLMTAMSLLMSAHSFIRGKLHPFKCDMQLM